MSQRNLTFSRMLETWRKINIIREEGEGGRERRKRGHKVQKTTERDGEYGRVASSQWAWQNLLNGREKIAMIIRFRTMM